MNTYFMSIGPLVRSDDDFVAGLGPGHGAGPDRSDLEKFLPRQPAVTIGNVIGGALMVGAVHRLVYLRPRLAQP